MLSAAPPNHSRQAEERRAARANPTPANDAAQSEIMPALLRLIAAGRQEKGEPREPIPLTAN